MELLNLEWTLSFGRFSEFVLESETAFLIFWTCSEATNDSDSEGFFWVGSTWATFLAVVFVWTGFLSDASLSEELFDNDLLTVDDELLLTEESELFLGTGEDFGFLLDSLSLEPKQLEEDRRTAGGFDFGLSEDFEVVDLSLDKLRTREALVGWLKLLAWLDDRLTVGAAGLVVLLLSSGEEDFLWSNCLDGSGLGVIVELIRVLAGSRGGVFDSSLVELDFLETSFGGEHFLLGADLGFEIEEAALDNDSVDDLLEPVAFWNVFKNDDADVSSDDGFVFFDETPFLGGGDDFFFGRAGLEPRPLSRDECAFSSLLLLLEYPKLDGGGLLAEVNILMTDGDW
jgi:hypothetical protein